MNSSGSRTACIGEGFIRFVMDFDEKAIRADGHGRS